MRIETIVKGMLQVNTYVVINEETRECVVIDAADSAEKLARELADMNVVCKAILLTHGHFDHIGAVQPMQASGVPVYMHIGDKEYTDDPTICGYPHMCKNINPFTADHYVTDGEVLNLAGMEFKVITTPGHSQGSVCYKLGNILFSGDTLFKESIGRSDFYGGSQEDLLNSIKNKIFTLENCTVYPGHYGATSTGWEEQNNPYIY